MEIKNYDSSLDTVDALSADAGRHRRSATRSTSAPAATRQHATCIDIYNNILNFRGHGIFVPGEFEILKVGKR